MTVLNSRYGVPGVPDVALEEALRTLYNKVQHKLSTADKTLHRNIVDPFAVLLQSLSLEVPQDTWQEWEIARQINKTLANGIGELHQEILGTLPGWKSLAVGARYDLIHEKPFGVLHRPVVAEVKNKYNTTNAGSEKRIYQNLKNAVEWKKSEGCGNWVAYRIDVIPKSPEITDTLWNVSGEGTLEYMRRTSAAYIFAESTGDPDAFQKYFAAIPAAFAHVANTATEPLSEETQKLFRRAFGGGDNTPDLRW